MFAPMALPKIFEISSLLTLSSKKLMGIMFAPLAKIGTPLSLKKKLSPVASFC